MSYEFLRKSMDTKAQRHKEANKRRHLLFFFVSLNFRIFVLHSPFYAPGGTAGMDSD